MKRLSLILLCISVFTARAQSPILEQYIEQGLANNYSLQQQNLELDKALKGIEIARTNFFPRINFAPTYSIAFGGRKIAIPVGDLMNPVYATLNQLTGSQAFPQVENVSEQLAPMNFHDTKMEIQMPLFNSNIKHNVALQKSLLNMEQSKKKFLEYELRHTIEAAYYQYLQALEAIKIFESSEGLLESHLELNKRLVKNHEALKDVVYSSEYELSKIQQQKEEAIKNKEVAMAYFNFLINRPLTETIEADTSLISKIPTLHPLEKYVENAIQNRPEFSQIASGMNVNRTLLEMQEKNAALPQVFLGANTGFQGFGYTFKDQAYLVGQVGLNWQIFNAGEKKMKIQQTKISNQILTSKKDELLKQVEMQVFQKYKDLTTSISNIENKNLDVKRTQLVFDLINSRYKNGAAISIELIKAQNDLLVSELHRSLSQLDIWTKYAALKHAGGY